MNEFQAAMGLENLKIYKSEQQKRAKLKDFYDKNLAVIRGIRIPQMPNNTTNSYQYYPIVIEDDYPISRDELYDKFRAILESYAGWLCRRSFTKIFNSFTNRSKIFCR